MISSVRSAVDEIAARVYANERRYDDLEQYSRSNCIILHGCRDLLPKNDHNKATEEFVISNLNSELVPSLLLTKQDIDIFHHLSSNKGKNLVIIKFVRRTVRNEVFNRKSKLKSADSNSRLAITEPLTKRRLKLVEEARRAFEFRNVWTMKGRPLAQLLSASYRCGRSGVRFPGRSNRHSVANDSPPLRRFFGAV